MMSLTKPRQTIFARDFSLNMEVFLMVHLMSPHQLLQTVIARDFPHSVEVARDFFHNMEITRY